MPASREHRRATAPRLGPVWLTLLLLALPLSVAADNDDGESDSSGSSDSSDSSGSGDSGGDDEGTSYGSKDSSDLTQLVSTDQNCHELFIGVCFKLVCTPAGCSTERANDISYYLPAFFIEVVRSPGDSIIEDGGSPGGYDVGTTISLGDHSQAEEYGSAYEVRVWDIRDLVEELLDDICLPCAYASAGIGVGTSGVHIQEERRRNSVPEDWAGGLDAFADAMKEVSSYVDAYLNMKAMVENMESYVATVLGQMDFSGDGNSGDSGSSGDESWRGDDNTSDGDGGDESASMWEDEDDSSSDWMGSGDDRDSEQDDDTLGMSDEEALGRDVAAANETCAGVADVRDAMVDLGDITEDATNGFVRLIYTTEVDIFHWRTGCRDLGKIGSSLRCLVGGGGGESCVGKWGPLYPRSFMAHGGPAVTAALAAYRGLHMADDMDLFDEADDDMMPDVFTDGVEISLDTKLQSSLPEVSDCYNPGERGDMAMTRTTGYDSASVGDDPVRFGFMMWVPDKCCLTDDELQEACGGGYG